MSTPLPLLPEMMFRSAVLEPPMVLLDEIEVHLHPRWQIGIVEALRHAFPRVRFIASTHSPLCLHGLEREEIRKLAAVTSSNAQARLKAIDATLAVVKEAMKIHSTYSEGGQLNRSTPSLKSTSA